MNQKYFTLLLLPLLSITRAAMALNPGDAAPPFSLPSTKDETVASSALAGKAMYIDFWASWCGTCRKSFPILKELQDKYHAEGFEVVAINIDKKRENADKFLNEFKPTFTVLLDPEGSAPKSFEMKALPSSFVVDRKGKITKVFEGAHGSSKEEIDSAVHDALAR